MKILLQHKASGLYLKNLSEWVNNPEAALSFRGTTQALRLLQQQRLTGVQLVLTFEGDSASVPIPLEGETLRVS